MASDWLRCMLYSLFIIKKFTGRVPAELDVRHLRILDWFYTSFFFFSQKSQLETAVTEVESVASFRWTFENFPEMTRDQGDAMGNEPITSDQYGCEGHTWRGLFRSNGSLFLQLLSASHPVTAEIR